MSDNIADLIATAVADDYGDVLDDGPDPAPIQVVLPAAARGHSPLYTWDGLWHGLIHAELMRRDDRMDPAREPRDPTALAGGDAHPCPRDRNTTNLSRSAAPAPFSGATHAAQR